MRYFAPQVRSSGVALATAALFCLAGCGGGAQSPEKARAASVAEAGGGTLQGAILDRWLMKSPTRPSALAANLVVGAWINTALLIDAVRKNAPLTDSATVDAVILPDAERTLTIQYLTARDAKRPAVTEPQVDSLLDLDRVRVFQQIYFGVKPTDDSATVAGIVKRARTALARILGGADFTAMVKEVSEDTSSRTTLGFLPAITRDQLADPLAPIWALRPNEVARGIFPGGASVHLIRRATRAESRAALKAWLAPRLARAADSTFVDSLARAHKIVVAPDAQVRIRSMAQEPGNLSPGGPLVTWQGGSLSPELARTETLMLPPADRYALAQSSDSMLTNYLVSLARTRILLTVVTQDPLPTAAARAALGPAYRRAMDSLTAAVNRLPAGGSSAEMATRYIDSMLVGRARFLALPGALAAILRGRQLVTVSHDMIDGVLNGVAVEWQQVHKNDSTPSGRGGRGPGAP